MWECGFASGKQIIRNYGLNIFLLFCLYIFFVELYFKRIDFDLIFFFFFFFFFFGFLNLHV